MLLPFHHTAPMTSQIEIKCVMCVKITHAQTKRSLKTLFMVGTGLSSEKNGIKKMYLKISGKKKVMRKIFQVLQKY